jgi:extradiol dioxygenase family protein
MPGYWAAVPGGDPSTGSTSILAHQVAKDAMPAVATNPVDDEEVPASHFGLVLPWDRFDALLQRLAEHDIPFVIEPTTRFAGRRGEQRTCFVRDPAGNHLEFKTFRHPEMLFASDGLDYR